MLQGRASTVHFHFMFLQNMGIKIDIQFLRTEAFFWWKHLHRKMKTSVIMHVLNCLIPINLQVLDLVWAVLVQILIW